MNWNRVQTILITILIIINIGLYVLFNIQEDKYKLTSTEEKTTIEILGKNNIKLIDDFPSFKPMRRLKIDTVEVDENKIIDMFLEEDDVITTTMISNGLEYKFNGKRVIVMTGGSEEGIIKIFQDELNKGNQNLDEEEAIKLANEFIDKLKFLNVNWEITSITEVDNETYSIIFNEFFEGYPIFSSFVKININKNGIVYTEIKVIDADKFVDEELLIYPIDKALFMKMEDFTQQNVDKEVEITNIEIGYDTKLNMYQEEKQYVEPYYRIIFSDGEEYYIETYEMN
ncbi:MAG: hypothetical protein ACLFMO_04545 [Eubacteriales bacterium]